MQYAMLFECSKNKNVTDINKPKILEKSINLLKEVLETA